MSYNKVILIGNAGRDPEIRYLDKGTAVVTLPVATTERVKDRNGESREVAEWHNVVFWRDLAEVTAKYVKKGSQIFIEGKLRTRTWNDQTGQKRHTTEIVAETLKLLSRREYDNTQQKGQQLNSMTGIAGEMLADNLPF